MAEAGDISELSLEELAEVERVEVELSAFISKRAEGAKDRETADELWAKSVREDRKKRNQQNAQSWYEYHDRLLRSHEDVLGSLVLYHRRERARYAQIIGLPEVGEQV